MIEALPTAAGREHRSCDVRDRRLASRMGKVLFPDATQLDGDIAKLTGPPVACDGGTAYATLLHAGEDCETRRDRLREAMIATPDFGASARDGLLIARFVAADGFVLRAAVIPALTVLREGRSLLRVWTCRRGEDAARPPREKDKLQIAMSAIVARKRLERG